MSIHLIQLFLDFGLVVLIWMVQIIIYPSFRYYKADDLLIWHKHYIPRISIFAIPLMLIQLGFSIFQTIQNQEAFNILNLILIIIAWISTFTQLVPIHNQLSLGISNPKTLSKLVQKNWIRTISWTIVFLIGLLQCFYLS